MKLLLIGSLQLVALDKLQLTLAFEIDKAFRAALATTTQVPPSGSAH